MNPMERLGTPDDIAEFVSFLAGPARWVNGQSSLRQRWHGLMPRTEKATVHRESKGEQAFYEVG